MPAAFPGAVVELVASEERAARARTVRSAARAVGLEALEPRGATVERAAMQATSPLRTARWVSTRRSWPTAATVVLEAPVVPGVQAVPVTDVVEDRVGPREALAPLVDQVHRARSTSIRNPVLSATRNAGQDQWARPAASSSNRTASA